MEAFIDSMLVNLGCVRDWSLREFSVREFCVRECAVRESSVRVIDGSLCGVQCSVVPGRQLSKGLLESAHELFNILYHPIP